MAKKWIQKAVDDKGRVREYLMRVYGTRAFKENGNIKLEYINKAIGRIKNGKGRNYEGILNALYLAKRLKKIKH